MIIGVTGPNGRLGSELVRRGCTPISANILDFADLRREIRSISPDVVIHCAAYTDVDGCENAPIKAAQTNTGGVYALSQSFSGKIVYISTDYIFDGEDGPYAEEARPSPISVYGWSKLGGEIVLHDRQDTLIIRTTILFDLYSRNFVTLIIRQLQEQQFINVVPACLIGSPTYVPHLAEAILVAIDKGLSGIVNIAGNRVISRLGLTQRIAAILHNTSAMIMNGPVTGAARRPLKAGLKVDKAQILGLPIYDPLDGIREILATLCLLPSGHRATESEADNALETMATGRSGHY